MFPHVEPGTLTVLISGRDRQVSHMQSPNVFADLNPFQTKTAPRFVLGTLGNFIPAPHPNLCRAGFGEPHKRATSTVGYWVGLCCKTLVETADEP